MTAMSIAEWEERLREIDYCPWPGPRPLDETDGSLLIGRDEDATKFRHMVETHRLVVLDGKSGIGKSSLLNAKLIPALRREGEVPEAGVELDRYVVAMCRDWSYDGDLEPADFLAAKVKAALREDPNFGAEAGALPDDAGEFFVAIEDDHRRFVIILDQFEELIRYSEDRAAQMIDTLVLLNQNFAINVVVSLRSEFLHELRPLERQVRAFSYATYELNPVKEEFAPDLITAPNRVHGEPCIAEDAAERLALEWLAARAESGSVHGELFGGIGLLHLQAALYALHASRTDRSSPRSTVTLADLEHFQDEAAGAKPARSMFAHAMIRSVDVKLERASEACRGLVDQYVIEGVRSLVARCAPHLSSAGYKLHRETSELAGMALEDELENLKAAEELPTWGGALRHLVASIQPQRERSGTDPRPDDGLADFVAHGWHTLTPLIVPDGDARLREWTEQASLVTSDPDDPSCGPMMGLPPGATLVEELRRFAFAIAWMERSSLVRLSTPAPSKTMVSLIHDRFGEGLIRWAESARRRPEGALHALTAPKGAEFVWLDDPALTRTEDHRALVNLRWKGSFVKAGFKRIAFVNCDLRGTLFRECRFEGVAFLNCLLDGAMFDRCTIVGKPSDVIVKGWDPEPSRFELPAKTDDDRSVVDAFSSYRGGGRGSSGFYSPLPGLPAVPNGMRREVDVGAKETKFDLSNGGLTVYGGRVSTLNFRGCTFEGPNETSAMLAFRYVAGSGLDIVEQVDFGEVEIYGSAIRHVTITAGYPSDGKATFDEKAGEMRIGIGGSSIAQLWVGERVPGTLEVDDCKAVQLWNTSADLTATVRRSAFHGLVGFTVEDLDAADGSAPMAADDVARSLVDVAPRLEGSKENFLDRAAAMDYMSDPARRRGTG